MEYAIRLAFEKKDVRGWETWSKMYWAIDVHGVLLPSSYSKNHTSGRILYPGAKEVLEWISRRVDMYMFVFSSTHPEPLQEITSWIETQGNIRFDAININPDCKDTHLCSFSYKPYFDIFLDDKAGFNASVDWEEIRRVLTLLDEWSREEHLASHEWPS